MFEHETVLLNETVEGLNIKHDGIYVDCTLGGGGHSEKIVQLLSEKGKLFAFDQDSEALKAAKERLSPYKQINLIHTNFSHAKDELLERGISGIDGVVFDLGVSSPQFDIPERGFSYRFDAPLDMRMDRSQELTAYEVVNEWSFHDIWGILSKYGEEKFSKQIARKIEKKREERPIKTTFELVEIIKDAIPAPARRKGGHPAKRTFQAIRIAVNDEIEVFKKALEDMISLLNPNGRIAVITFHSLEDRLCKKVFISKSKTADLPRGLPVIPKEALPELKVITRKPIVASSLEEEENHRAHSAKLRIAEKNDLGGK